MSKPWVNLKLLSKNNGLKFKCKSAAHSWHKLPLILAKQELCRIFSFEFYLSSFSKLCHQCAMVSLKPWKVAGAAGLEPATYGFGDRRSTS